MFLFLSIRNLKEAYSVNRSRVGSIKSTSTVMLETLRVMESTISILLSVCTWPQEMQHGTERPISVLVIKTGLDEDSPRTF